MFKKIIVIPVYKSELSEFEKVSLTQCCKILKKHKFFLVCPNSLSPENHLNILNDWKIEYEIEKFDGYFFKSIRDYNTLMLNANFYERFACYDFMLVYQLDAYVFRDELNYWCEKNYDYIGAPWFEDFSLNLSDAKLLPIAGNGGFSLRKIKSFIEILKNCEKDAGEFIKKYLEEGNNEDMFFSNFACNFKKDFKVASSAEGMFFSFETHPEKLYFMTEKKLPFGCHAWERYNLDFWEPFLELKGVDYKKENKLNLQKIHLFKEKLFKENTKADYYKKELELRAKEKKIFGEELELRAKEIESLKKEIKKIHASFVWKISDFFKK
jgi:hypothetical protein